VTWWWRHLFKSSKSKNRRRLSLGRIWGSKAKKVSCQQTWASNRVTSRSIGSLLQVLRRKSTPSSPLLWPCLEKLKPKIMQLLTIKANPSLWGTPTPHRNPRRGHLIWALVASLEDAPVLSMMPSSLAP
jgi:hypothetical protein